MSGLDEIAASHSEFDPVPQYLLDLVRRMRVELKKRCDCCGTQAPECSCPVEQLLKETDEDCDGEWGVLLEGKA